MINADRMVALVHDLKNPLVAIERLSERLLESNSSLSDDCRHKIRLVYDSAAQAIEQLEKHDFSSLVESERKETCPSSNSVDLGNLAREVVESFQAHAEYKNQTLECAVAVSASEDDSLVVGDPDQLRKALNAIVSNAIKYSPHGETIGVHVRLQDNTICFSVRDNGPGLTQDAQQRIFEPFREAGPDPTGNESSTGVGLYIARKIVNNHNGTIEVESSRGAGSTFTLRFPAVSCSDRKTLTLDELQGDASGASVRQRVS